MARRKHATLAQRGERADASHAAARRAVPAAIAVGAVARTPIKVKGPRGTSKTFQGSNRVAAAAAAGTVAYSANRARRQVKAKQGFKPIGYRGQVGRGARRKAIGRGGHHHASRQRRDQYGRFA
jgi:hypothetical protein